MKAFVSYSRADRSLLDQYLAPILEQLGIKLLSDKSIPPAATWTEWVLERIRDGDFIILLLTENYQQSLAERSGACYAEYNWIVQHYISRGGHTKIVAVLYSGELPAALGHLNAIDLRSFRPEEVSEHLRNQFSEIVPKGPLAQRPLTDPTSPGDAGTPEFRGPQDILKLVRNNFNTTAARYNDEQQAADTMQRKNAVELLRLIQYWCAKDQIPEFDTWLDLGCGTGLAGRVMQHAVLEHRCDWLRNARLRLGCDYARDMLQFARQAEAAYTNVFELDVRDLTQSQLGDKAQVDKIGLIVANNVFHWLYDGNTIRQAMQQCHDVLHPGGVLAASIAACGTGLLFLSCYQEVIRRRLGEDELEKWKPFLKNPIGLQTLMDTVRVSQEVQSFRIIEAKLTYEPVTYPTTDDYIEAAENYGREVYLAPLIGRSAEERNAAWNALAEHFRTRHMGEFNRQTYIHDQFMIYLILRRI